MFLLDMLLDMQDIALHCIGFQEKTTSDKRCSSFELLGATLEILISYLYKSPINMLWKRAKLFQDQIKRHLEASEGFMINRKMKTDTKLTVLIWSQKFD